MSVDLPAPRRADEEHEVALGDDEVDVAQGGLAVRVGLRDVVEDEDRPIGRGDRRGRGGGGARGSSAGGGGRGRGEGHERLRGRWSAGRRSRAARSAQRGLRSGGTTGGATSASRLPPRADRAGPATAAAGPVAVAPVRAAPARSAGSARSRRTAGPSRAGPGSRRSGSRPGAAARRPRRRCPAPRSRTRRAAGPRGRGGRRPARGAPRRGPRRARPGRPPRCSRSRRARRSGRGTGSRAGPRARGTRDRRSARSPRRRGRARRAPRRAPTRRGRRRRSAISSNGDRARSPSGSGGERRRPLGQADEPEQRHPRHDARASAYSPFEIGWALSVAVARPVDAVAGPPAVARREQRPAEAAALRLRPDEQHRQEPRGARGGRPTTKASIGGGRRPSVALGDEERRRIGRVEVARTGAGSARGRRGSRAGRAGRGSRSGRRARSRAGRQVVERRRPKVVAGRGRVAAGRLERGGHASSGVARRRRRRRAAAPPPVASRSSSACMNASRSPSRTAWVLPVSCAGPEVLDHLVGVQDVAPDLVAPAGLDVLALELADLGLLLLERPLEEARLEDPDRHLLVLGLAPLVLALGDDARSGGGSAGPPSRSC